MSLIDATSIEYEERFTLAAVRYTFESVILDPGAIGHHLRHLAKAVERHLMSNQIFYYQLGINISSGTFKNFNACLAKQHNFELMQYRLGLYAQSFLGVLAEDNKLTVVVTALLLYPTPPNLV